MTEKKRLARTNAKLVTYIKVVVRGLAFRGGPSQKTKKGRR